MPSPSEKLALSLEALHDLQVRGRAAIRSGDLSRTHRERLLQNGFLQEVIKGWFIATRPDEPAGESTAWYASFWDFCAAYLNERFGADWSLSPEQSLLLHAGNRTVPRQLLVRVRLRASNNVTLFPHGTSLLDVRAAVPEARDVAEREGLRLFSLPAALVACAPGFFVHHPTDARAALALLRDASDLLPRLLEGGHSTIAGRLAGALRNLGREQMAQEIVETLRAAGYAVREGDPFAARLPAIAAVRESSPYANRLRLMWQAMRPTALARFPPPPGLPGDAEAALRQVEAGYVTDAYHSLSIEGYRVSRELVERVRQGDWNPDADAADRGQRDAMAARGYWQAFRAVRESLRQVLEGANSGAVAEADHRAWYREMFAPSIAAGVLRPADLAGYRNDQVYIRRSMHVPPNRDAVRDLMPVLFELLREEPEAGVRAVLGHFAFVHIHPYMDGNGRLGRFLMNLMLTSGGYPWTVIPLEMRDAYMAALEAASAGQDITPFADFLARRVQETMGPGGGAPSGPYS